ncbi:unnamed protein product [Closterium sp. Naga37s-1]|nr:unnamed protein product [Closterium sp. Naga37s-1]
MHRGHHSPTKVTPSPSSPLPVISPPRPLPSPSSPLPVISPPRHLPPPPSSPLPVISPPPRHLPLPSSPLRLRSSFVPSSRPPMPSMHLLARPNLLPTPLFPPSDSSIYALCMLAHVRVVWHVEGQQALWEVQAGRLLQQGPPGSPAVSCLLPCCFTTITASQHHTVRSPPFLHGAVGSAAPSSAASSAPLTPPPAAAAPSAPSHPPGTDTSAARIPSTSADAESAGGAGNDVSEADWRVTVLDRGGWKEWEMVVEEEEPEEGDEGEEEGEGEEGEEAGREGGSGGEKGAGVGPRGAEVRRLMREYRERTKAEGPIAASELEGFGEGADVEKKQWAAFQAVIAKAPEQVIRYCRSATARPLWPQLQGQPPSQAAIPPCSGCGAQRIFEFQVRSGGFSGGLPQCVRVEVSEARDVFSSAPSTIGFLHCRCGTSLMLKGSEWGALTASLTARLPTSLQSPLAIPCWLLMHVQCSPLLSTPSMLLHSPPPSPRVPCSICRPCCLPTSITPCTPPTQATHGASVAVAALSCFITHPLLSLFHPSRPPPQVLPQIIYYSAPDATADSALDFAMLAVYVCPNSCCRSSPFSTAQQSSGTDPSSSTSTEDTAGGTSAERSSRDAGSGQAEGGEAATQHGGLQEQSMRYVEEFVWVQLPSQDPPVVASTD